MSGEQFYINYSLNGEHYAMGPYHTRRFAMSHIDDIRRQPGASNVYLGNKPPDDKSYRKRGSRSRRWTHDNGSQNRSSKAREAGARPQRAGTGAWPFREEPGRSSAAAFLSREHGALRSTWQDERAWAAGSDER